MDVLYVFLATCSILTNITDQDLCEDVLPPTVEERKNWSHMGNYSHSDETVILRKGLYPKTRDRVMAHEIAHHILHVSGVAPVDQGYDLMCVSEVYSHQVTQEYADAHDSTPSPGEIDWLPRYPHCWDYIEGEK